LYLFIDRPVRKVFKNVPPGRRRPGRPRKTWKDTLEEDIRLAGQTWQRAKNLTQDRGAWSRMVTTLCTYVVRWAYYISMYVSMYVCIY
jgi:hypothetical protein